MNCGPAQVHKLMTITPTNDSHCQSCHAQTMSTTNPVTNDQPTHARLYLLVNHGYQHRFPQAETSSPGGSHRSNQPLDQPRPSLSQRRSRLGSNFLFHLFLGPNGSGSVVSNWSVTKLVMLIMDQGSSIIIIMIIIVIKYVIIKHIDHDQS